jgi:hypothetical protein
MVWLDHFDVRKVQLAPQTNYINPNRLEGKEIHGSLLKEPTGILQASEEKSGVRRR